MKVAESRLKTGLAISIITADDKLRSELVPLNKKYGLKEIVKASREYNRKTRKRITYEYVMFDGINDSVSDAEKLLNLFKSVKYKVNIIPYNSIDSGKYRKPSADKALEFQKVLIKNGIKAFIRKEKGVDIEAACGQLAGKSYN